MAKASTKPKTSSNAHKRLKSKLHEHRSHHEKTQKEQKVTLESVDGKKTELNLKELNTWLAAAEKSLTANKNIKHKVANPNDAYFANLFAGRFGLQNSMQVINFLKSPAGRTVRQLVAKKVMVMKKLEEAEQIRRHDELVYKRRALAFFLMLLADEEAHAKHLNELIAEQVEKELKESLEIIHKGVEASQKNSDSSFLDAYDAAIHSLDHDIATTEADINQAHLDLDQADKTIAHLAHKYNHLSRDIDSVNNSEIALDFDKVLKIPTKHQIEQALRKNKQPINQESYQEHLTHDERQKHIEMIDNVIAKLKEQNIQEMHKVSRLVAVGKESEAEKALLASQSRLLQAGAMQDMRDVITGHKLMYTRDLRPAKSLNEAHFVLKNDMKLVKYNNSYYLLPKGKKFKNLSQEEREEAHNRYKKEKSDLLSVGEMIKRNHKKEHKQQLDIKNLCEMRIARLHPQAKELKNKLRAAHSARAEAQRRIDIAIEEGIAPAKTQAPTPRPILSQHNPRVENTVSSYKDIILRMSKKGPTPEQTDILKGHLSKVRRPEVFNALEHLKPGREIPKEVLKNLLSQAIPDEMKRIVATKLQETGSNAQPAPEPNTAPTPFTMRPSLHRK